MITFLTVAYIALLLLAFKMKWIKPTLWWKLSPIFYVVFLTIALFIPMQFWAPSGPLIVGQYAVQVVPNVAGEVIEVPVKPNVPLKEGDVLFRIDPTQYEAALGQITAQSKLARLRLEQTQELAAQDAVSQYELDQVTAQVEQLEAGLKNAEYNLRETTVRAPFDGYVTNLALRPGARVTQLPFVQAMSFIESGRGIVAAEIVQNQLRYIQPGQFAEIAFKGYPGQIFEAEVEFVVPAVVTGQMMVSGLAAKPRELPHTPFWVRVVLGEEAEALDLPVGATGTVAIYTERGTFTHVIRRVVLRMESIMNYINPF